VKEPENEKLDADVADIVDGNLERLNPREGDKEVAHETFPQSHKSSPY